MIMRLLKSNVQYERVLGVCLSLSVAGRLSLSPGSREYHDERVERMSLLALLPMGVGPALPTAAVQARVLAASKAIVFIDYAAVGAMRTVMPFYAKELGAAALGIGALETVYGLGQIGGAVFLGKLSDAKGRKAVLLLSFFGSFVGYMLAGWAVASRSITLLLLSRRARPHAPPPPLSVWAFRVGVGIGVPCGRRCGRPGHERPERRVSTCAGQAAHTAHRCA